MEPRTSIDHKFWPSVGELSPSDQSRVVSAFNRYNKSPTHPSLRLHALHSRAGKQRLWTISAASHLRILLARQGSTTVFLRAGQHDFIYALADRSTFIVPITTGPQLISIGPRTTERPREIIDARNTVSISRETSPDDRSILQHYTDQELTEAGFEQHEIVKLRRATQDTLLDIWANISEDKYDLVIRCMEHTPEELSQGLLLEDDDASNEKFRSAIVDRGALSGLSSLLTAEEVERLMSAPIEDWMIFLHPDQRAIVNRRYNGPARVRGAAGTGKTVVALHRAAILARRFELRRGCEKILFTTYIKSLPPVLSNLYDRLPNSVPRCVDFTNVDKLAHRLCREFGQRPRLSRHVASQAFDQAFDDIIRVGTPLHGFTKKYLRDEVGHVLKGRGVESLDDYLNLERTGRKTRFSVAMRTQMWQLHEEWNKHLRNAGIEDFPDVVRRARDLARNRRPMYHAAIIDESQDLSLVALQMVHALVGCDRVDREGDSLFIVGDGAQKIYPGGFTLAQAGLDVRGNSTVLRVNYRNSKEIMTAAMACVGSETVDDLGDKYRRNEADVETSRAGMRPRLVHGGDFADQISFVASTIDDLCTTDKVMLGDIGILAYSNDLVNASIDRLKKKGIECQSLENVDGRPTECVKVGTFHRAKGLEFKIVFLINISDGVFPRPRMRSQSAAEYEEDLLMQKNQLYVAMNRARDGLFILHNGEPSEILYEALDHLDEIEA